MMIPFPRIPRSAVLGALALGAGLLAASILALHVRERERQIEDRARLDMVERIVAARDLAAGTRLTPDDLAVRGFPVRWVGSDTLPLARLGELEGRILSTAVRAGDALLPAHTVRPQPAFSEHLAPGRRAITLPVDQLNSLSGLLQPGDLIDLYVSFEHRRKRLTAPLLQGVLVLATGRETRASGPETEDAMYSTVTLDAAPEDVVKLVAARQAGTLTAILRHPGDARADRRAARGDLATLLGVGDPPRAPARRAVILYGTAGARALPAWARPEGQAARPGNGWFDLPEGQALASAWMHALAGQVAPTALVAESSPVMSVDLPFAQTGGSVLVDGTQYLEDETHDPAMIEGPGWLDAGAQP
ncbi:MAG: Flp pilus assembly protein CpaB [Castellaniella sp.]|uniref:Flp pilus assembly protein CpaB n=1 Tax=Castellaniella sp. TaxID=1955812 RepID=UPI002A3640BF|nr:Flp pilus assembly protein CpaB [Castellaniella sp.]MDY0309805.1 Flp pilus assembly protein CpaB [Castellaniella sp.]